MPESPEEFWRRKMREDRYAERQRGVRPYVSPLSEERRVQIAQESNARYWRKTRGQYLGLAVGCAAFFGVPILIAFFLSIVSSGR